MQGIVAEPFPGGKQGTRGPQLEPGITPCEQEVLLGTSQSREGRNLSRGAEDVVAKGYDFPQQLLQVQVHLWPGLTQNPAVLQTLVRR